MKLYSLFDFRMLPLSHSSGANIRPGHIGVRERRIHVWVTEDSSTVIIIPHHQTGEPHGGLRAPQPQCHGSPVLLFHATSCQEGLGCLGARGWWQRDKEPREEPLAWGVILLARCPGSTPGKLGSGCTTGQPLGSLCFFIFTLFWDFSCPCYYTFSPPDAGVT